MFGGARVFGGLEEGENVDRMVIAGFWRSGVAQGNGREAAARKRDARVWGRAGGWWRPGGRHPPRLHGGRGRCSGASRRWRHPKNLFPPTACPPQIFPPAS